MSILDGVVAMELDSAGHEEPSTPLRDSTFSPAVHIQWQNSQSACAAMDELRVASSMPRHPPKPLTFDFELPASAGPSSRAPTSDPLLFSSRTRLRSARSRNIERVQSRSQNDVFASPAADASKFLDMLGRVSVCVDENSRKRMKVLGERARGPKKSSIKGKERLCATARSTRSMDEFGDHTNFIRDAPETRVHYSSLPTIILESQSKDPSLSQRQPTSTTIQAEYKKNNVHTHNTDTVAVDAPAPAPGNDGIEPPVVSTRPHQNGTQHFPSRATFSTRHSQKRIEPPSPTPLRSSAPLPLRPVPAPAPTPAHVPAHKPKSSGTSESALPKSTPAPLPHQSQYPHLVPVPTPPPPVANDALLSKKGASASAATAAQAVPAVPMADSLTRHGRSTSASTSAAVAALPPPSQTHGFKRALGMTRIVPRSSSSSSSSSNPTSHSAAAKKPFRPPLTRPAAPGPAPSPTPQTSSASATKPPQIPLTSSHSHDSQRQQQQRRRQEDGSKKGSGSDPDSSFDISFDFDPEALEAAMKQYD